jgi:hypothetical protein
LGVIHGPTGLGEAQSGLDTFVQGTNIIRKMELVVGYFAELLEASGRPCDHYGSRRREGQALSVFERSVGGKIKRYLYVYIHLYYTYRVLYT